MEERKDRLWNPYVSGALAGVLSVASVAFAGKYLGASTTFVRAAGYVEKAFGPERVAQMAYFMKEAPKIDWQFMFVIGIFLGALAAALLSGTFSLRFVPDMWKGRFGPGIGKRGAAAFVGGIVAMIGARLADGCPSGHGLSGVLQLAVSGFIALAMFFIVGVLVARMLYGGDEA